MAFQGMDSIALSQDDAVEVSGHFVGGYDFGQSWSAYEVVALALLHGLSDYDGGDGGGDGGDGGWLLLHLIPAGKVYLRP
jgi:hypothetical protein